MRTLTLAAGIIVGVTFIATPTHAWTTPPASPPNSNVSAPINVGATAQTKNGTIGVNGLAVFGDSILQASSYLNWGGTSGTTGYGIRDTAGSLEFKNSGGTWQTLQAFVAGLGGTTQWTTSGTSIYYNTGNVGVGTVSPGQKLTVEGTTELRTGGYLMLRPTANDWDMRLQAVSGNKLNIYSGGDLTTPIATFVNGGNVGIGTEAPGVKLEVSGAVSGNYVARFVNSSTHGAMAQGTTYGMVGYATTVGGNGILGQNVAAGGGYGYVGQGSNGVVAYSGCGTSACYGVQGNGGSYYGALGRADGYSYVGSGTLYNNGPAYATSFLYLSDKRLKENIRPLQVGLAKIMALEPVNFTWKKDIQDLDRKVLDPRAGTSDIGFIAQEVETILPQLVHTDNRGTKSVDYVKVVPVLVRAVQEQQNQIDELKAAVRALQEK